MNSKEIFREKKYILGMHLITQANKLELSLHE